MGQRATSSTGIVLVLACSLLNGVAQLVLKGGTDEIEAWRVSHLLANYALLGGLALYGASAVLFLLALQRGQLSVLYPFLGATYVWVTLSAPWFFPTDSVTPLKGAGVVLIAAGVSLIGRSAKE